MWRIVKQYEDGEEMGKEKEKGHFVKREHETLKKVKTPWKY